MSKFQMTISGDSFLFSRLVDFQTVKKITALVLDAQGISEDLPASSQQEPRQNFPTISEFLVQTEPQRSPDKIATIAYYLWKYQNQSHFEKGDLIDGFEKGMEPLPKNLARDLVWTQKIGWITVSPGSQDTYYLTQTGKEAVEAHFSKQVIQKTTIASVRK